MAIFQERKVKTSILFTLTLLFFFISVIPLGFSTWRLVTITGDELQSSLQESFVTTASNVSSRIETYLNGYKNQIREFAPKARGELQVLDREQANSVLPSLMRDPNILKVRVFNLDGKNRFAQSMNFQDPSVAEHEFDGYNHALQGNEFLGSPYFDGIDDLPLIFIAVPLKDNSDRVVGVLSAVLNTEPLLQMLGEESVGGKEVYVVDSKGKLLFHPHKAEMKSSANLSDKAIVQDFLKSGGRVSTVRLFEDHRNGKAVDILGSYSSVADPNWGVIVQIDRDIAYGSVSAMILEAVRWGLLFALAATLIGFLLARWITTPVQVLAQHALEVGRHQNFDKKIDIKASNEIQQLADTFNYMTDEIKQNILGLQQAARENKELFMSSIRMLAAVIDAKDPYTRGHSERVKDYSMVIGKVIGLNAQELERLEITALLHDVGKIGIDDRILRKPTNLTPEEFEIMKTHPDKGATILAQIQQLHDIIPGMRAHHENYDGSGYPQGLKGEEIPMFGRLITVADTFDAMTTDRPYQKAFTLEFALNRIRTMASVKYDPKIVDAFSTACQEGLVQLHKPSRPRPKQPVA